MDIYVVPFVLKNSSTRQKFPSNVTPKNIWATKYCLLLHIFWAETNKQQRRETRTTNSPGILPPWPAAARGSCRWSQRLEIEFTWKLETIVRESVFYFCFKLTGDPLRGEVLHLGAGGDHPHGLQFGKKIYKYGIKNIFAGKRVSLTWPSTTRTLHSILPACLLCWRVVARITSFMISAKREKEKTPM